VRTKTFWNRKIVLTSTPTLKGFSRIEQAYETSDKRRYHVACPHCDHGQVLGWEFVQWEEDKPQTAALVCQSCGVLWSESDRQGAVKRGEWVATEDAFGVAGFHLSELYSPWSTPAGMAAGFLEAKHGGTEQLKAWINTSLGESWEEDGETIPGHVLMERREEFSEYLPEPVRLLTMGVDIQADRIEAEVVGWGDEQESWSVEYMILPGDPAMADVWMMLADAMAGRYLAGNNRTLSIACAFIDSGYLPQRVYEFCRRTGSHAVPTKGMAGMGRPIVETSRQRIRRLRKRTKQGVKPELIGADEGKLVLFRRLRIDQPGPGYCHFPMERDQEYFEQLTAEKLVTRYSKGRPVLEWVAQRARNEALDIRVLAHAALLFLGPHALTRAKHEPPAPTRVAAAVPQKVKHRQPLRPRNPRGRR